MLRLGLLLLGFIYCVSGVFGNCCVPQKYFAVRVNVLNGIRSNYFADYEKQKILIKPRTPKNYAVEFFLKDFRHGKTYIKYKDGSCKFVDLDPKTIMDRCIPKTATRGANQLFGLPGAKMVAQQWNFQKEGASVQMTVSARKCIPVLWAWRKGKVTTPFAFYNTIVMYDSDQYFNQNLTSCVPVAQTVG